MIALCILLLLVLFLLLRLRFDIACTEDVTLALRILFVRIPLYPAAPKKVKLAKFKRGYPKEKKNADRKPNDKKAGQQAPPAEKIPLGEKIGIVLSLLRQLCKKFFKHLRLDVSNIVVTVGADDAASAAITYGIVSQAVAYLLAFLDTHLRIRKKRRGEIAVRCDFTTEKTVCDIRITASLAVWQLLDIGISLAYNYFKGKDIFNLKKS